MSRKKEEQLEDEEKIEETLVHILYTRVQKHMRKHNPNESQICKRKSKPQPFVAW